MTTMNEWILPPDVLKDRSTSHCPALAKCGDYLYMAWKGSISDGKDDERIWFSRFDGHIRQTGSIAVRDPQKENLFDAPIMLEFRNRQKNRNMTSTESLLHWQVIPN